MRGEPGRPLAPESLPTGGARDDIQVDAARTRIAMLVGRLRTPSARARGHQGHTDAIRRLVGGLAAITAPGRPAPEVPAHAWGDVVTVLAGDALDIGGHTDAVLRLLDEALEATR